MNLRTYILTLLSTCALMYAVVKILPDDYSYIQNPIIYTISQDMILPNQALQEDKNGCHYVWVEEKKCFANKRNIDIKVKNDTVFVISGVKSGEKILVFHQRKKDK